MTKKTLIDYLEFLKTECLRYKNDKLITDDEILQLNIEIDRFKKLLQKSSISNKVKTILNKIDFNLDEENHLQPKFKWLNFIGNFQAKEFNKQENRKQRFLKLYNDLDTVLFNLKLNT